MDEFNDFAIFVCFASTMTAGLLTLFIACCINSKTNNISNTIDEINKQLDIDDEDSEYDPSTEAFSTGIFDDENFVYWINEQNGNFILITPTQTIRGSELIRVYPGHVTRLNPSGYIRITYISEDEDIIGMCALMSCNNELYKFLESKL